MVTLTARVAAAVEIDKDSMKHMSHVQSAAQCCIKAFKSKPDVRDDHRYITICQSQSH